MGSSPNYKLVAAPGGDVIAMWFHSAPCTAATYRLSGTCKYHYYAKYSVSAGTWSQPIALTDSPADLFDARISDRGDLAFLGSGWERSGTNNFTPNLTLITQGPGEASRRTQLLGAALDGNVIFDMDGQGNLLLAAQVTQNATRDIVAYRGTTSTGLGEPQVLDTRGATATLRLARAGLSGEQAVLWNQNNGIDTSTFAATAGSPNSPFSVADLGFNIGSNLTLLTLTISDAGVAQFLEVGFFARRRLTWTAATGWSTVGAAPDELYARGTAVNRNGDILLTDTDGSWGTYDGGRNVMVRSIRDNTPFVLGVRSQASGTGSAALSVTGAGFVTLLNRFDTLPTSAAPAGDGRNVVNLWGAYFK